MQQLSCFNHLTAFHVSKIITFLQPQQMIRQLAFPVIPYFFGDQIGIWIPMNLFVIIHPIKQCIAYHKIYDTAIN